MDPLELVRSRNRWDVELPGENGSPGFGATIGLPSLADCVLAGRVPMPVLRHLQDLAALAGVAANGDTPAVKKAAKAKLKEADDLSPEEREHVRRFDLEIARRTLKRLAPSVAELDGPEVDMPAEVLAELSDPAVRMLIAWGTRAESPPKAGAQT